MSRFGSEEEQAVLDVIRSGDLSPFYRDFRGGEQVQKFEEEFARFVGAKHAVSTSNGTSALHTAMLASGNLPRLGGSWVATTPASFMATTTAILMCGWHPAYFDIDRKDFNLVPQRYGCGIIVPVDLLGVPADVKAIRDLNPYAIIIEDACQALGSPHVGEHADVTCHSFQETKTMTTLGEGGMLTTNNDELADRARSIRNAGSQYADADYVTYNYRMTEAQAAFGRVQLRRLPRMLEQQRENAFEVIRSLPRSVSYSSSEGNYYIVGCVYRGEALREKIVQALTKRGVNLGRPGRMVGFGYTKLIYERPLLKSVEKLVSGCENAEWLAQRWLWFDIHRFRPLEEVKVDMEIVNKVIQ